MVVTLGAAIKTNRNLTDVELALVLKQHESW
jgi:hypothetical protein